MEVLQLMSLLSLRPLLNKLARTPGNERPEQVVAILTDLFQDAAEPMARALRRACASAWEVVEVALAGEGFWNGCRVFLSADEHTALSRQVGRLRKHTPPGGGVSEEQRRLCLAELQRGRNAGALSVGGPDLAGLLSWLRPLARHEDPRRLSEVEWEAVHRLAGELRRLGLASLARFAEWDLREGVPTLIASGRYFLCREIAATPELSRRLAWDGHCDVPAEQQEGLAELAQTMTDHGRGLREWLQEDVSGPPVPKEVHAHASSVEGQPAPGEGPGHGSAGGWQGGVSRPGADAPSDPARSPAAPVPVQAAAGKEPLSRRQRLWGWLMPLLVLGLPMLLVVWMLHHYTVSEVRRFEGHQGLVSSVAFSPDGRFAVSGGADKTVRLWEVASGAEVRRFDGHKAEVNSVAFSPDGKRIVSGGMDWAYVWDVGGGQPPRRLDTPTNFVLSVAFSPDGKQVLTTSKADHLVRLWDVETGKQVRAFEGHTAPVNSAVFSPDGKQILSGGDVTVRLWDLQTGQEERRLVEPTREVRSVAFSPDGTLVAAGAADRIAYVWRLGGRKEPEKLPGAGGWVTAVAFSPDGSGLLEGSLGQSDSAQEREPQTLVQRRNLRMWNVAAGREVYNFLDSESPVWSLAISPDGAYVLSGGTEGALRLWGLR